MQRGDIMSPSELTEQSMETKAAALEALSPEDRQLFDDSINNDSLFVGQPLATDIARKFRVTGFLSEKQLAVLMRLFRRVNIIAPEVDSTVVFTGTILRKEVVAAEFGSTNKYVFAGTDGLRYNIKTTSKKLCPTFDAALEQKKPLTIEGTVVWVAPDKSPVCLSGRAKILN